MNTFIEICQNCGKIFYQPLAKCCYCGSSSDSFPIANVIEFECDIPLADLKEITKVSASIVNEND